MSIKRGNIEHNYSVISNDLANDDALSFEARGMLLYLLSKPEDWTVRCADVCKQGNMGRDRYYRIVRELEDAGYMVRIQSRDDGGKITGVDYIVHGSPQPKADEPPTDRPVTENPVTDNPTHTKELETTKNRDLQKPDKSVQGEKPKRKVKTDLPPECPSDEDRQKAIAYWNDKRRNDLSRDVGTIADQFRAYHESRGSKMVDWSAAWRTWYCNQVTFRRPPPGHTPPPAPTEPDGWAKWEKPVKAYLTRGIWNEMLGRAPGVARCPVPDEIVRRAVREVGWEKVNPHVQRDLARFSTSPARRAG